MTGDCGRSGYGDLGSLADELLDLGRRSGLDAVGVAGAEPFASARHHLEARRAAGLHGGMHFTFGDPERATDPARALPGARALVVGARTYARADPSPGVKAAPAGDRWPVDEPSPVTAHRPRAGAAERPLARVARYSWQDHYAPLRQALAVVAGRLTAAGWRARVLVDDNRLVDKEAAYRAGLGWYGKNTLLLLPGRGSWFVLGSVVTDAPLPAPAARVEDGCRTCTRCLQACPTGALVAPGVLDARRCLAWLLEAPGSFPVEFREALGGRIYGCDECQEACPPNRLAARRDPPPAPSADDEPEVDLVWLLDQDDASLMAQFGRWYVPRRQARYLRRNALVALGNVASGSAPGVAATLARYLESADPLLRAHAVWASSRVGRSDLLAGRLGAEPDPGVREELRRAGAPCP